MSIWEQSDKLSPKDIHLHVWQSSEYFTKPERYSRLKGLSLTMELPVISSDRCCSHGPLPYLHLVSQSISFLQPWEPWREQKGYMEKNLARFKINHILSLCLLAIVPPYLEYLMEKRLAAILFAQGIHFLFHWVCVCVGARSYRRSNPSHYTHAGHSIRESPWAQVMLKVIYLQTGSESEWDVDVAGARQTWCVPCENFMTGGV